MWISVWLGWIASISNPTWAAPPEDLVEVRARFASGQADLASAYPDLPREALGDAAVVRGRLALLDEAAVRRARSAAGPPPDGVRPEVWRRELGRGDQADEAERRLLVAILARLQDHEVLRLGNNADLRAPHDESLEQAREGAAAAPAVEANLQRSAAASSTALGRLDDLLYTLRIGGHTGILPDPTSAMKQLATAPAGSIEADAAADRLWRMAPFLGDPAVDQVLLDAWAAPDAAPVPEPEGADDVPEPADADGVPEPGEVPAEPVPVDETPTPADLDTARIEQRIAEGAVRVAALRLTAVDAAATDPLSIARRGMLTRRLGAARQTLANATGRLGDLAGDAAIPDADLVAAQSETQKAQDEAEAARASATDARARRRADALADFAEATSRRTALQEAVRDSTQRTVDQQETLDRVADLERQVQKVHQSSTLSGDRPDPDTVYRALRGLLKELRQSETLKGTWVLDAQSAVVEAETGAAIDRQRIDGVLDLVDTLPGEEGTAFEQTLASWSEGLDEELALARQWSRDALSERDQLLGALQSARVAKRDLSGEISRGLRQQDRAYFLQDLVQEGQMLGPSVLSMIRGRALTIRSLPNLLTDWNVVRAVLASSFWSILSGLLWWWARGRADSWALNLANRVRRLRTELRMSDVRALRDPVARAIRNGIDLALGPLLLWSLGDGLPELQFLVSVYLYLATYRAMLALFDLAVVPATEVRPALVALVPDTHALARRTVQAFLAYFIVARLLQFLLWDVLSLDTLSGLEAVLLQGIFFVLVAWTLYRWEPILRGNLVRRSASPSAWVAWLQREDGGRLLRVPRAAGHVLFLAAVVASNLSHRLAREGTSLAWVFNAVNRYRLQEAPREFRPLPEDVQAQITGVDTPSGSYVERPELVAITTALQEWRQTGRRGLVAVVGDRGSGKNAAFDEIAERIGAAGLDVHRGEMPSPVRTRKDLFDWLMEVAGVEGTATRQDELVQALKSVPPRAILIEEIHRCFSRRVGGLGLVQALLYVLNAASDHHFFAVSVHGPSWDYFDAVGSMVDCGVFHTAVRLAPMTSQQLRALTLQRAGRAGIRIDFSGLKGRSALGGDPEHEGERAIGVAYRLLAEASGGNPTVAVHLFTQSLEATEDPKSARMVLGQALSMNTHTDLSDNALFVLVALNLHDELPEPELVAVTNLSHQDVRGTVRDLVSRGLVVRQGLTVVIPDRHRPEVQRTLRRRHFLHMGGTR